MKQERIKKSRRTVCRNFSVHLNFNTHMVSHSWRSGGFLPRLRKRRRLFVINVIDWSRGLWGSSGAGLRLAVWNVGDF